VFIFFFLFKNLHRDFVEAFLVLFPLGALVWGLGEAARILVSSVSILCMTILLLLNIILEAKSHILQNRKPVVNCFLIREPASFSRSQR
jgi:hypothetical protein